MARSFIISMFYLSSFSFIDIGTCCKIYERDVHYLIIYFTMFTIIYISIHKISMIIFTLFEVPLA